MKIGWKTIVPILGGTVLLLLLVFLLGPRISTKFSLGRLSVPDQVDEYVKQEEAAFPDIVPGTEKKVFWAGAVDAKTPLSLIYVHGFTATRQELSPVFETVARTIGANIFLTRLKGHGRGADAMQEASLDAWMNDLNEAWEIGKKIGGRVIAVGTSTGAPLVLWLGTRQFPELACLVLVSANFRPRDASTGLLLLPWSNLIVKVAVGDYFSYPSKNELNTRYWTTRYSSNALLAMMSTVSFGQSLDLATVNVPSLWLYTEQDDVVSVPELLNAFGRTGGKGKKAVNIEDAKNHVLAGDAITPETTGVVIDTVLDYLRDTGLVD